MMEMVRGAVFSMVQSHLGAGNRLPEDGRWLDLFAGTGALQPVKPKAHQLESYLMQSPLEKVAHTYRRR